MRRRGPPEGFRRSPSYQGRCVLLGRLPGFPASRAVPRWTSTPRSPSRPARSRPPNKGAVTKAEVAWTAKPLVKAFGQKAFFKDQSVSAAITKTGKYFTGKLTDR
ncbi:hypothetical protein RB196_02145 [Streptomyces sp. PmtA]